MTQPTDIPLPMSVPGMTEEELRREGEMVILRGLLKRFTQLQVQALEITREADAIKARMRQLGRGSHDLGIGKVTISPNRRFDPKLADEVLRAIHPDLVSKCSTSKVDAELVKRVVGDDVYEQCQKKSGDDKVSFS